MFTVAMFGEDGGPNAGNTADGGYRVGRKDHLKGLAACAVLVAVLAVGCGSTVTSSPTSTTGPAIDARAVLSQAAVEILQLESARFILEHEKGSTTLFPGLEMMKAAGVVEIPDRVSLTVEGELAFPRSFIEASFITIGDEAYMTDLLTRKWREVPPETLPVRFADLGRTLADIIGAVEEPTVAGSERLQAYDTYHIEGRIKSEALSSLVPGAGEGFSVGLDLWLEQSRKLLLQVRISGKVLPTDIPEAVRLLTLDQIDVPVNITAPE